MLLENYIPQSKLVTATTAVNQPSFTVIDVHNHLGEWEDKPLTQLLDRMDEAHMHQFLRRQTVRVLFQRFCFNLRQRFSRR